MEPEAEEKVLEDDDILRIPFTYGWKRELVRRNVVTGIGNRSRYDCYYFTPSGKKLRSRREVVDQLEKMGSELTEDNFSFAHELLGMGEPLETIREAGRMPKHLADARELKLRQGPRSKLSKVKRTRAEDSVLEGALSKVMQRSAPDKRRVSAPGSVAAADTASHTAREVLLKSPRPRGRPVKSERTPHVVVVRPRNGALPAGPGAPRRVQVCHAVGGRLTARAPTLSLPDLPYRPRKLKMMVKGDMTSPPPLVCSSGTGTLAGVIPGPGTDDEPASAPYGRLVVTRPWRLAVVNADGRSAQLIEEPGRMHQWRLAYQAEMRAQASAAAAQTHPLRIGRLRQYSACTLFCPRQTDQSEQLPSLRCVGCYCLSHPVCVGLLPVPEQTDFLCMSCFDRLRRHPDSKSTLPYGVTSRPGVPKRRCSNSEVEEIILLEESDVFGHDTHRARAASQDPLWEPSDDDRSGSSDGSYDESDIESLMNDAKKLYAVAPGTGGPSTLTVSQGPPTLTARPGRPAGTAAHPSVTGAPRPPPLQRAPPQPSGTPHVVMISRPKLVSPPSGSGGGGGGGGSCRTVEVSAERPRRPSGHGCKVRVTGLPDGCYIGGSSSGSAAPTSSGVVVVVRPRPRDTTVVSAGGAQPTVVTVSAPRVVTAGQRSVSGESRDAEERVPAAGSHQAEAGAKTPAAAAAAVAVEGSSRTVTAVASKPTPTPHVVQVVRVKCKPLANGTMVVQRSAVCSPPAVKPKDVANGLKEAAALARSAAAGGEPPSPTKPSAPAAASAPAPTATPAPTAFGTRESSGESSGEISGDPSSEGSPENSPLLRGILDDKKSASDNRQKRAAVKRRPPPQRHRPVARKRSWRPPDK